MKRFLLLFCFCLLPVMAFAQISDTVFHNFTIKDCKPVWSFVYEGVQKSDVVKYFSSDIRFVVKHADDNVIIGYTRADVLPYEDCGYKESALMFPYYYPCEISFTVNLDDYRYRVVADNIEWTNNYSFGIPAGGIIIGASGTETYALEDIIFNKRGKFHSKFLKKGAGQLDLLLISLFTVRFPEYVISEEW